MRRRRHNPHSACRDVEKNIGDMRRFFEIAINHSSGDPCDLGARKSPEKSCVLFVVSAIFILVSFVKYTKKSPFFCLKNQ